MRRIQATTLVAATWMFLTAGVSTESPVEINVYRRVLPAPADFMVTVRVPPDPDNRALTIEADSGEYLSSSTIPLDGEYESHAHQFWLKNLPEGEYVLMARVQGSRGVRAKAALTLSVVGQFKKRR